MPCCHPSPVLMCVDHVPASRTRPGRPRGWRRHLTAPGPRARRRTSCRQVSPGRLTRTTLPRFRDRPTVGQARRGGDDPVQVRVGPYGHGSITGRGAAAPSSVAADFSMRQPTPARPRWRSPRWCGSAVHWCARRPSPGRAAPVRERHAAGSSWCACRDRLQGAGYWAPPQPSRINSNAPNASASRLSSSAGPARRSRRSASSTACRGAALKRCECLPRARKACPNWSDPGAKQSHGPSHGAHVQRRAGGLGRSRRAWGIRSHLLTARP